ncbi:MAG: ferrous iron transport protein A [Rhodospirillales bacterium]|nr:ferrous iron transport protein A [Rhodospirillales bacterium]MCW8862005.1 ferrous iron transport protein A [Rhodospirillales bacterium]MCW8952979.1 ferrous iron transport protein A [Rhodospirillales bacterium]MCW8970633.1 ferrous iron transport protein A [Rhodospirillales bacterium]MCW9002333.1 ferrous iron transport protein A [Rhodospirillales bacterium]
MNAAAARKSQEHAFPLALATPGERLRIAAIRAGKGLGRRLYDIGLPIGAEVEVLQREGHGRLIVARDQARVALGAGASQKIMVTLIKDEQDKVAA